jgi:hypothetical protein
MTTIRIHLEFDDIVESKALRAPLQLSRSTALLFDLAIASKSISWSRLTVLLVIQHYMGWANTNCESNR